MKTEYSKNFTVYQASAGSGKTYNLARIFIESLLAKTGDNPAANLRSIMAITFTKKAANEMKERVLSFLDILANEPDSNKTKQNLLGLISVNISMGQQQIEKRAALMLKTIMENYSDLSIGTIDSFNHRIVKSFARELGVNFEFDVQLNKDDVQEEAINRLFERFGRDKENEILSQTLVDFFLSQLENDDESTWNLKYLVKSFTKDNFNDERYDIFEKYPELSKFNLSQITQKLKTPIEFYINEIKKLGAQGFKLITQAGLTASDLFYSNRGIYPFFEFASKGEKAFDLPNKNVMKTLEEDKWTKAKPTANAIQNLPPIKDKLGRILEELVDKKKEGQRLRINRLILKQIHYLLLIRFIDFELNLLKEEENILLIDDFNRLIDKVVKNEPVPFIYEKIGERYKHYLIDEFQDTAIKQWHNFVPLIDNALSAGNQNLIVGDGKQAIYRWREGEVELFHKLPEIYGSEGDLYKLYEQNFRREFKAENLRYNYRSGKEIVRFNNRFYNVLKEYLGDFESVYDKHEQKPVQPDGYVRIEVLDKTEIKENDLYLEKTFRAIKEAVNDGYLPSEIAVLSRKGDHLKEIAEYLTSRKITIESSESLMLKKQPGIQFLISIFKYLLNPDDKIVQFWLYHYLIDWFSENPNLELQKIVGKANPATNKLKELGLDKKLREKGSLPLYQMAIEIEKDFKLGISLSAYFNTFLDLIDEFENKGGKQLDGFIEWWEEIKPTISTPDNPEAVKLLTIHSAKGLEFPVVVFPFVDWKKQLTNNYKWVDSPQEIADHLPKVLLKLNQSQLENTPGEKTYLIEKSKSLLDDINLLYVATTRPSERLYMFTSDESSASYISAEVNTALQLLNIGENKVLELGTRRKKTREKTERRVFDFELKHLTTIDRQDVVKVSYEHLRYLDEKRKKALDYGKTIHRILEEIETSNDVKPALESAYQKGIISKEEADILEEKLSRLLLLEPVSKWFSAEGIKIRERELADDNGRILRPDRIVVSDDRVSVIDYKTGRINKEDLKKYKVQINEYVDALKNLKYENVSGYILSIDSSEVIAV